MVVVGGWWGDKKWLLAREEGGRKFQGCQVASSLGYNKDKFISKILKKLPITEHLGHNYM